VDTTTALQKREVFHLVFLRTLLRAVPAEAMALKGGTNLRFLFHSIRYSENLDLDTRAIPVHALADRVMSVLTSRGLADALTIYGVVRIVPPDLRVAKHTQTVQRFTIHLRTESGEDLLTKVEFARRGFDGETRVESVSPEIVSAYRMPPLIVPHYTAAAAIRQKIKALAARAEPQARDIFDLHVLRGQPAAATPSGWGLEARLIRRARERALSITYRQYQDTVVAFLHPDDRPLYDSPSVWEEIRLPVVALFEQGGVA
jgi:predicted nucleotidyltransferase component of viral defense system